MTSNQLKRLLADLGCRFTEGTKHTLVHYGERIAPLPRHGKRELRTGTVRGILKQLGLESTKR